MITNDAFLMNQYIFQANKNKNKNTNICGKTFFELYLID